MKSRAMSSQDVKGGRRSEGCAAPFVIVDVYGPGSTISLFDGVVDN